MTKLRNLIRTEIETAGPITVSRYIQLCLGHPELGYYVKRDPLGRQGDFTTAPEISQLFGELIGAWLIQAWQHLGSPKPFALIELGPGRGTLIADVLRVARLDPSFSEALTLHLVEASPTLRAKQTEALAAFGLATIHHDDLESLPNLPALWVANEFLDALPTNQWVRSEKGWHARKIGLDGHGGLTFGVDPTPLPAPKSIADCPPGTILEHSPAQDAAMAHIASHMKQHGGAGLIIDYGALKSGIGDTLQAVRNHQKADPLANPGDADLTTHVDFEHLARLALESGVTNLSVADQGSFLLSLGLLERAGQLGAGCDAATQDAIRLAVERLAGDEAMGQLFKVMGLASASIPLPGLAPILSQKEPA